MTAGTAGTGQAQWVAKGRLTVAMASSLRAMASNLTTMASNVVAMASNLVITKCV